MCLHTHHLRYKIYHVVHENRCEEQIKVPLHQMRSLPTLMK
jgi:hypothetical protein